MSLFIEKRKMEYHSLVNLMDKDFKLIKEIQALASGDNRF